MPSVTKKRPELAFGRTLRDERTKAGWTQPELALRSGVSIRTIAGIENFERGYDRVTLLSAVRLADALKLSIDTLIGRR